MSARDPIEKLLKFAHATLYAEQHQRSLVDEQSSSASRRFITISRQAGARGLSLAWLLAERLNAVDPAEPGWAVWDRTLVEKIVSEHHLSRELVESIERPPRRWWQLLSANWSDRDHSAYLNEFQVYQRVANTIHALAHAGRAIIVGRGGVYATADLPDGIHLRLVAPLETRVAYLSRELNIAPKAAMAEVQRRDRDREEFHHRYFPGKSLLGEVFTLTLNSGVLSNEQMIGCILPLILDKSTAAIAPMAS